MNTDLLKTFLEVAKTRHFGQAASNLYLTQSAVSSRIKLLEETIGVDLFMRQRNNILLTSSGERLMSHAENLLASWQIALQEVGTPSNRSMQLTLGGTANLWDTYLQSALPKLVSSVSNLYVRTEISSSQELTHALLAGRIDIVTVFDPPTNADLESRKVARLELVMVSTQPNLAIEDIPTIGHVFVDWGTVFNMKQAKLFKNPTAPILHTGQSLIALNFLLSHGGAAFLPSNLVAPYIKRGTLHYVLNAEKASQDFYLVHSKKSEKISYLPRIVSILEEFQH